MSPVGPDVRVRLAPEGQAEVVAALKKVLAESQRTQRESAKGFGGLGSIFGNLKNLVAGLGVALSARAFVGFIRGSVQMVGAMHETAQAIGTTTENASALDFAARQTGVGIEKLHTALPTLARNLIEAAQGGGAAAKALRQLETVSPGLRKALLATGDSAEQLAILSQAFAKLPDGPTKSALALQIFGRAGAALLPLVNELGQKSLPTLKKEAGEAGQLVSNELSRGVDRAADQMNALRTQAQILGAQFFLGLAPDLRKALAMISGDLKSSGEAWRDYGREVGEVLPGLVLVFGTAFDFIASGIKRLGQRIAGLMIQTTGSIRAMNAEAIGDTARAEAEREAARKAVAEIAAEMEADEKARLGRLKARMDLATRMRTEVAGEAGWHPPMAAPPDQANLDMAAMDAQKVLDVQKAAIDNEISLLKAKNALRNEEEKQAFDAGLRTVQEHYAERRQIIQDALEAEIAALLRKKALLAGEDDEATRKKEGAAIDARIAELRVEAATEGLRLNAEEMKAVRNLGDERTAIEKRILEFQGNRHEAAMADIDAEVAAAREKLNLPFGPLTTEQQGLLDALRARLEAREAFEEAQRQAEAGMAELELHRVRVQAQMDAGLISQADGERQLLEIERGRIAALEELARKLLAAAKATGDPALIQQAEEFGNSIIGVGVRVSELDREMQNLGATMQSLFTSELADFLGDANIRTRTWKDSLLQLANAVQRVVANLLAMKIVGGIGSLFGGLFGGSGGGGTEAPSAHFAARGGLLRNAPARRFSGGGYLRGPGSGTSDSLAAVVEGGGLARFSNREFVVRERVTSEPGALDFLERFNQTGMRAIRPITYSAPRFAGGGLVSGSPAQAGTPKDGKLTVGLEPGLILRELNSPQGQKLLVQMLGRNRRAVRTAIGG